MKTNNKAPQIEIKDDIRFHPNHGCESVAMQNFFQMITHLVDTIGADRVAMTLDYYTQQIQNVRLEETKRKLQDLGVLKTDDGKTNE